MHQPGTTQMTPKAPNKPAELLNDLESIRALLGDDFPDTAATGAPVDPDSIPLLSDIVEPGPATPSDDEPRETSVRSAFRSLAERHIDHELRTAANLILQEVIDDFVPQIEAELKRRLESRIDRLVRTPPPRS